jgi:hypothetical protein
MALRELEGPPAGLLSDHIDWWKQMESSQANTKPEAESTDEYKHGHYTPQYNVAKMHIKRQSTNDPSPDKAQAPQVES